MDGVSDRFHFYIGGPLVCSRADGSLYQAGIVSWGWALCADAFHPDVSTDVALFTEFIAEKLKL
jgi:secreted trypsin-like serine protease